MFDVEMPELIVILIIALLVFGAGRLPEIGTSLGQAMQGFKKALSETDPHESKKLREEEQKNNRPQSSGNLIRCAGQQNNRS